MVRVTDVIAPARHAVRKLWSLLAVLAVVCASAATAPVVQAAERDALAAVSDARGARRSESAHPRRDLFRPWAPTRVGAEGQRARASRQPATPLTSARAPLYLRHRALLR